MQLHKVTSGLQSLTPMDLDHNLHEGAGTMFARTVQQMRGLSAEPGPSSKSNSVVIAKAAALQSLNRSVTKTTCKSHTCRRCGVGSCQGKREVKYCLKMCWDCGSKNCKRRNSKKPQKFCREGWDD